MIASLSHGLSAPLHFRFRNGNTRFAPSIPVPREVQKRNSHRSEEVLAARKGHCYLPARRRKSPRRTLVSLIIPVQCRSRARAREWRSCDGRPTVRVMRAADAAPD